MHLKQLCWFSLLSSSFAFAALPSNDQTEKIDSVKRGLQVSLKKEQLENLSDFISGTIKGEQTREHLQNQNLSVKPIIKVSLEQISADITWEAFHLQTGDDQLDLMITPKQLGIHVETLTLAPYLLPFLKTTCTGIDFLLGGEKSFPIKAQIKSRLEQHQLKLSAETLHIQLEDDQYSASGPISCKGPLGGKAPLTQLAVKLFLNYSKEIVTKKIESKVKSLFPVIEEQLNQLTHLSLPLDLEEQFIFPQTELQLNFYPTAQIIKPQSFTFEIGMDIKPLVLSKRSTSKSLPDNAKNLASFGLNPQIITSIFAEMYKKPGPAWIIQQGLAKGLDSLLSLEALKDIFPDLKTFPYASPYARVLVALKQAPVFVSDEENQSLWMRLDDLSITLQVKSKIKNNWIDYYHLSFSGSFQITPTVSKQKISVSLAYEIEDLTGFWDESYKPKDTKFDDLKAILAIRSLFDYYLSAMNPIEGTLPLIKAGKKSVLGFDWFRVEEPFLKIDLLGSAQ